MSLSSLISEMEEVRSQLQWGHLQASDIRYLNIEDNTIDIKGKELPIRDYPARYLFKLFKIPRGFYETLNADLRRKVLAHAIGTAPDHARELRLCVMRGGISEVVGILRIDHTHVPTEECLKQIPPEWEVREADPDITKPVLRYRVINRELKLPKDVYIGYDLTTSEIGGSHFRVDSLLFVQVCANGLLESRRLPTGRSPFFQVSFLNLARELVHSVVINTPSVLMNQNEVKRRERQIRWSMDTSIHVSSYLEELAERKVRASLPRLIAMGLERAEAEGEISRYHLAQIISSEARDLTSRVAARALEEEAGNVMRLYVETPAYSD